MFFNCLQWSLNETAPVSTATARLTFGLLLDPDHCNSVLDKGPVANCSEVGEPHSRIS